MNLEGAADIFTTASISLSLIADGWFRRNIRPSRRHGCAWRRCGGIGFYLSPFDNATALVCKRHFEELRKMREQA